MIDWLSVRHFAIAAEVELAFDEGFSAITGETGSGKSLVVDALGVLLGGRAEQVFIQADEEEAEISGGFVLPDSSPVFTWLREQELCSESEVILRRVIRRQKPSRNYINGKPVNASVLKSLGELLVDIHGQMDHHSLLRKSIQLSLLDEAAGNLDILSELETAWDRYRSIERELQRVDEEQTAASERMDLLRFQLAELDQLAPQVGEWSLLSADHKRLSHASELLQGVDAAVQELFEKDESAHTVLTRVVTSLRQLEAFDASMGSIATMLDEAAVVTGEAAAQLRRLGDKANQDPAELQRVEERLSQWHGLARKHRVAADELPAHWASLTEALERLDNPEKQRDQLCKQRDEAERTCQDLTGRISKRRASSAHRLGEEITEAMQNLGMPGGRCEIALLPIRPGPMSRSGAENAEFRVSANAGQPVQSLTKIASGGELSRISLAIQVILASDASVPTIVFDEVDIGIGGTVANTIGEQLHQLGKTCQVICVTHLPQVAARADWQYAVTKSNSDRGIEVSWDLLAHEQRVREVARMSGSARPTAESLAHAEQMLHLGAESGGK